MLAERAERRKNNYLSTHSLCRALEALCSAIDIDSIDWSTCGVMQLLSLDSVPTELFSLALRLLPHAAITAADGNGVTPWHLVTASWSNRNKMYLLAPCLTPEERSVVTTNGSNALHCAELRVLLDELINYMPASCAVQENEKGHLPLQKIDFVPLGYEKVVSHLITLTVPALGHSSSCVVSSVFEVFYERRGLLQQLFESYPEGFLQNLPEDHWERGISPLHSAAARPSTSVEQMEFLLLYFSGFVSVPDSMGRTPLWYAALAGNVEVARLLLPLTTSLDRKAKISPHEESTLVEILAVKSEVDTLALLLEFDPSLANTPYDKACHFSNSWKQTTASAGERIF